MDEEITEEKQVSFWQFIIVLSGAIISIVVYSLSNFALKSETVSKDTYSGNYTLRSEQLGNIDKRLTNIENKVDLLLIKRR